MPFAPPVTNATFPLKSCFPFVFISPLLLEFALLLLRKLDGHFHRSRYVECLRASVDLCDGDDAGRRNRLTVLSVVNRDIVRRRPIGDVAHLISLRPRPFF